MGKRKIFYKKKSKSKAIKLIRTGHHERTQSHSSSASIDEESVASFQNKPPLSQRNVEYNLNFNMIVHMNSLLSLLQQVLCPGCNQFWNGSMTVKERNGLYMQLQLFCNNCGHVLHFYSSPLMQNSRRHEINVRLAVGGSLCGLGHSGLVKLLGALNLPSAVQEHKYTETQEYILPFVEAAQKDSMDAAVEEAITHASGSRDLIVSGDGAWLTRGFSSLHGIATLCSATEKPKVLDTSWCCKKCTKCQGAESLRRSNPYIFNEYQVHHKCQLNFTGILL